MDLWRTIPPSASFILHCWTYASLISSECCEHEVFLDIMKIPGVERRILEGSEDEVTIVAEMV